LSLGHGSEPDLLVSQIPYQPVIDGLRAVAVMSVVLFHAGFASFSGGYVGVDVFFVISGYLITRWILSASEAGQFSYSYFYLRRVRRLLPALLFTLAISFVLAALLFAPQHLSRVGGAIVYSLFGISNFYFWGETGYFDLSEHLKPLLHTWSLGVEEQFYLFWPITLVLLQRRAVRFAPLFILLAAVAGLYATQRMLAADPSAAFYLMPFRITEFAIGALLVWLPSRQPADKRWLELLLVAGLAMIAYAVLVFDSATPFPGLYALLPGLGAALVIYACDAPVSGTLLNNRVMVGIGLISYSLYLAHWPIIVFYDYATMQPLGTSGRLGIVLVSLLIGWLMYRYVETPFRKRDLGASVSYAPRTWVAITVISVLLLLLPATHAWREGGWLWRYPPPVQEQLDFNPVDYNKLTWLQHQGRQRGFSRGEKPKVLVAGDSQAGDFVNLLLAAGIEEVAELRTLPVRRVCQTVFDPGEGFYQASYGDAKRIERCKRAHRRIRDASAIQDADVVFLVADWAPWALATIRQSTAFLLRQGSQRVVLVGQKNQRITGVEFLSRQGLSGTPGGLRLAPLEEILLRNRQLAMLAGAGDYYDLQGLFCNADGCSLTDAAGRLLLYDSRHLTPAGATQLASRAKSRGDLESMLGFALPAQDAGDRGLF
jgi:peptidoglycan/LPS O-acetylase OafA/YrhL